MKTIDGKIRFASVLVLIISLIGVFLVSTAIAQGDEQGQQQNDKQVVLFDLKKFMSDQPNSQMAYDYMKLATALQGIVNRSEPQLFYMYESNYIAKQADMDIDQFWLDELQSDDGFLSSYQIVDADHFDWVLDQFSEAYNGVVVWDPNVPATANVASTAAGVDGWLPVRYDESPGSPYDELVVNREIPIKLNLVDKFTGEGTIPDTDLTSTGSAKNDAYLWAKERYLDSGLTNPAMMVYALDGVSWETSQSQMNARVVSVALPEQMSVGQEVDISITLENTGQSTWTMDNPDRVGATHNNQLVWRNLNGGYSNGPTDQRVFLSEDEEVLPGEEKTFEFSIVAPETEGEYTFSFQMVRDGVGWYGEEIIRTIEVTTEDIANEPPTEEWISSDETSEYPDLFNSFLPNSDYYIANKAFFFDLSPDETSLPIDDRDQPLGTDYNTLNKLLRSQNERAGEQIITIGGFVPWWLKYTTEADPEANLDPVPAEWKYADIISKYNAQKDADAYGLVGLSNASVYQHVPLHSEFKQKNDKGENGKTYDENTKYIAFYMGDYDAGAWTAGALPALWNDPKRGELPLGWPPVPGLSERVPQVFNYLYETMTENDYFIAGDNGAGYLNPMMLLEENRPDGLPDFLHVWEEYNQYYYDRFDLDITGFLISGNSGHVPLEVQESYSRFSPAGVGNNSGFEEPVVNDTPFARVTDLGHEVHDASAYGEEIAAQLQRNEQFFMFRNILTSPSMVVDAVEYVEQNYSDINFEVVDPYTYFRLYKEAEAWEITAPITYNAPRATSSIEVDGIIEPGEWDDAMEITVNAESEEVQAFGRVWGDITDAQDLTSVYRIQWDDEHLYLLEERQDDALYFTETGEHMYLSDATMLFLDLGHTKTGTQFRDGDYAISMTASGPDHQPHMFMREGNNDGAQEYPFTEGEIASVIHENGYTMEVAIPWDTLQVTPFSPEVDQKIGMTLLATDNDGPDNWGQIMWVGDGDDKARWADMMFVALDDWSVEEGMEELNRLIESGEIGTPMKKVLENSLRQFNHHWQNDRLEQARRQLENFQNHLQNKGLERFIDEEQKQELLQVSEEVMQLLIE